MRVSVLHDFRFQRTPDGAVWTGTVYEYKYWTRYLSVFDEVLGVSRIEDVPSVPAHFKRADGDGVSFWGVPYFVGPVQYLLHRGAVGASARKALASEDAVIARARSQIQVTVEPFLRATGRPYGMEVPSDPWDMFSPGATRHPLRPYFRRKFAAQLRRQCAGACAASYVTEAALQRRYPVPPDAFSIAYSDIEWVGEPWVDAPRPENPTPRRFRLLLVGTLEQLYKGQDVLIDAVGECVRGGLDLEVAYVGDGKHREELAARARAQGVGDRVHFLGWLPAGGPVRDEMDRADLFLLPSRQEGVPRAMIEAMARGVPCLGSTVGGIPEVLAPEDLVTPNDVAGLAAKIREVLTDPARMARMSARGLVRSRDFHPDEIARRQKLFFSHVRDCTEAWIRGRRGAARAVPA